MSRSGLNQRHQKEEAASKRQLWKIKDLAEKLDKTRKEVLDRYYPDHGLVENDEGDPEEWNLTKYEASELIRELDYKLSEQERRL